MSWGAPWMLLALLVPAVGAWRLWRGRRARPESWWPTIARVAVVGEKVRPAAAGRGRQPWRLLGALALVIVALAQPRWGEPVGVGYEEAREVMIALDLSRSMGVEDVGSTRLERANAVVNEVLDQLSGERVGLVVFAGTAFVQVPLSSDYQIIREFLPLLTPDYMPRGGSDYTAMLQAAAEGFGDDPETDRYLVVLSDGESTTEGWRAEVAGLVKRSIKVVSFAIGTAEGGIVPSSNAWGAEEEPVVISRLEPATLRALATSTDGVFHAVESGTDAVAILAAAVEAGRRGRFAEAVEERRPERFQWFLAGAALLALWGLWREVGVRPRRRTITPEAARAWDGVASLVVMSLVVGGVGLRTARAHDAAGDDGISFRATVNSSATARLLVTVEHLSRLGYDGEDVRTLVEETISYGIEAQTRQLPLQKGVIYDAIVASYEGERLDPSLANWGYLRAQLERILEPPPEVPQAERPPEEKKQALDEEDRPPETAGQSTQQTTSESGGFGGISVSEAKLGDLQESATADQSRPPLPPVKFRPPSEMGLSETEQAEVTDPMKALTLKNIGRVIKGDSPGLLHQAVQGKMEDTGPAGGRDY